MIYKVFKSDEKNINQAKAELIEVLESDKLLPSAIKTSLYSYSAYIVHKFPVIFVSPDERYLPFLKTSGSTGYDLRYKSAEHLGDDIIKFDLNLKSVLNSGLNIKIYNRSSSYPKWGLALVNNVGVIDSDYRGEYKALCHCIDKAEFLNKSNKYFMKTGCCPHLWQLLIEPSITHMNHPISHPVRILGIVNQVIYDNLDKVFPTGRGTGGFGSTDRRVD
jgi:dUTPase